MRCSRNQELGTECVLRGACSPRRSEAWGHTHAGLYRNVSKRLHDGKCSCVWSPACQAARRPHSMSKSSPVHPRHTDLHAILEALRIWRHRLWRPDAMDTLSVSKRTGCLRRRRAPQYSWTVPLAPSVATHTGAHEHAARQAMHAIQSVSLQHVSDERVPEASAAEKASPKSRFGYESSKVELKEYKQAPAEHRRDIMREQARAMRHSGLATNQSDRT